MSDAGSGLTACGGCAFWRSIGRVSGSCHRRAPEPGHGTAETAHWPETEAAEGCGDGLAAATSATRLTACRDCVHWREARAGHGLVPLDQRDHVKGWWSQAGYCVRHAPRPAAQPGYRGFWRATHATDGCAEGEPLAPSVSGAAA
jgi:hypothetical protein